MEMEQDGRITFLDIEIHREQEKLNTGWYMKPTTSGRMVNFESNLSHYQKINTARNFMNTAIDNRHEQYHEQNYIKSTLIHTEELYFISISRFNHFINEQKNSSVIVAQIKPFINSRFQNVVFILTLQCLPS